MLRLCWPSLHKWLWKLPFHNHTVPLWGGAAPDPGPQPLMAPNDVRGAGAGGRCAIGLHTDDRSASTGCGVGRDRASSKLRPMPGRSILTSLQELPRGKNGSRALRVLRGKHRCQPGLPLGTCGRGANWRQLIRATPVQVRAAVGTTAAGGGFFCGCIAAGVGVRVGISAGVEISKASFPSPFEVPRSSLVGLGFLILGLRVWEISG